jgi:hypothetical protein
MRIPFLGPTYASRSPNIASDRSINFYPEINQQDSKDVIALIGTPGTTYFTGTGNLPVRGMHAFNNLMYAVIGNSLYSINTAGVYSSVLGTLTTPAGRVQMADNGMAANGLGGNQLMIVDGANGYIWNALSSTFTTISGGGWPGSPTHVIYLDGYFIVTLANSMISYASNLFDGTTWSSLAYAQATSSTDNISTLADLAEQVWFIKQNTSECWYNNGVATAVGFPYSRVSAGVLDAGTPAPWSVARMQSNLFMLGSVRNNELGEMVGIVMLANGAFTVVSPVAINYQISQWPTFSDAFGYCYSEGGHSFYVLTSPSGNQTFVYDVTTQMCHERSTYTNNPYAYGRHLSNCYCFFNGNHYVGDWQSGNIYKMSSSIYTDNNAPIVSVRVAQHLSDKKTLGNLFFKRIIVDAETGPPGITGTGGFYNITIPAYNSDPNVALLAHFDGANGSTTFTDSSYNNYPITAVGGAKLSTVSQKFGTASLLLNGSTDYVTIPAAAVNFGSNNFSIDWQENHNSTAIMGIFGQYYDFNNYWFLTEILSNGGYVFFVKVGGTVIASVTFSFALASGWHHYELNRNGSSMYLLADGISQTPTVFASISNNTMPSFASNFNFGFNGLFNNNYYSGYFDELRISQGIARMAPTPPTAAYTYSFIPAQTETLQNTASNPYWLNSQAALSWSDDGGHTWSNDYLASVGAIGQYKTRLIWRRLGYSRDRVFRIAMSEPTKKVLIGAVVEGGE